MPRLQYPPASHGSDPPVPRRESAPSTGELRSTSSGSSAATTDADGAGGISSCSRTGPPAAAGRRLRRPAAAPAPAAGISSAGLCFTRRPRGASQGRSPAHVATGAAVRPFVLDGGGCGCVLRGSSLAGPGRVAYVVGPPPPCLFCHGRSTCRPLLQGRCALRAAAAGFARRRAQRVSSSSLAAGSVQELEGASSWPTVAAVRGLRQLKNKQPPQPSAGSAAALV